VYYHVKQKQFINNGSRQTVKRKSSLCNINYYPNRQGLKWEREIIMHLIFLLTKSAERIDKTKLQTYIRTMDPHLHCSIISSFLIKPLRLNVNINNCLPFSIELHTVPTTNCSHLKRVHNTYSLCFLLRPMYLGRLNRMVGWPPVNTENTPHLPCPE